MAPGQRITILDLFRALSPASVPYAELIRIEKPADTINLYFPYLFGCLYAACLGESRFTINQLCSTALLLLGLSFFIRSIGCTWNDYVDRELDKHTERCCRRPIARGAITPRSALVFMLAEYFLLFTLVLVSCKPTLPYLVAVISTGTLYAFTKRITHFAQLFLGIILSAGVPIGCMSLGLDPARHILARLTSDLSLFALMAAWITWTMIYDTIYAFQDLEPDKKIGNKAMSVRFENGIQNLFYGLSVVEVILLVATGWFEDFGAYFYASVALIGSFLLTMLSRTDMKKKEDCRWWFEKGSLMVGFGISACILTEYGTRSSM
ncbi:UbiA prenyltransferase family [Xylariomycetidae sp. FL0641]|nr:UbiA prenyltransferase family [Xylariomycetidae sp. FL0641]